ncbi:MAG: hypothetical protein DBX55_06815 [Verrucomicrobia bacterium]|nr:MAG: hypothetical protein DBX55_06815 [Verrucomicrobiota bacterium]
MMQNGKEKRNPRNFANDVLHRGFGSARDRVFGGAKPSGKTAAAKMRSIIGYTIAAAFIFGTVALLFTLLSEAGRYAETLGERGAAQRAPKESPQVIFTPAGTKAVVGKDGNLTVRPQVPNADSESAKAGAAVPPNASIPAKQSAK